MKEKTPSSPLIIAGMHRSGTSMISSYLSQIGLDLGGEMLEKSKHNPKGYFEDLDFLDFHRSVFKKVLKNNDKGWLDWGYDANLTFNEIDLSEFTETAKELLNSKEKEGLWGWKEPRSALFLDFWEELCPSANFLLIYRSPWEVALSVANLGEERLALNSDLAFGIWQFYNEKILSFYLKHKDKCVLVNASSFIQDPKYLSELLKQQFNMDFDKVKLEDLDLFNETSFNSGNSVDQFRIYQNQPDLVELMKDLAEFNAYRKEYKSKEKVSIVIPCYNQGRFVEEAICSIERGDASRYEIIVVNDGSDDEESIQKLNELRSLNYRIIDQENKGLASARNVGIEASTCKYILPLDADNRVDPEYYEEAIDILEHNKSIGVVYSNSRKFGVETSFNSVSDFEIGQLLAGNFIDALAVFRKEVWEEAQGYDKNMPIMGYEDWDFWISAFDKGWGFHRIDKFLFDYRVQQDSMISEVNRIENRRKLNAYVFEKHSKLYFANFKKVRIFINNHLAMLDKRVLELKNEIKGHKDHKTELFAVIEEKEKNIETQLRYNESLNELIKGLEQRIGEMQNSRWWKAKMKYGKFKSIFKWSRSSKSETGKNLIKRIVFFLSAKGRKLIRKVLSKIFKMLYLFFEDKNVQILEDGNAIAIHSDPYANWMAKNLPREEDYYRFNREIETFNYLPKFSVIIPCYNAPINFLIKAIESVQDQIYSNWELCISDDASDKKEIKGVLEKFASEDERIKVVYREENGHISANTNSAIDLATGDYIVFLDQDDLLSKDALFQFAAVLNEDQDWDMIYSDEDKVDESGNFSEPHFKPDFSPENLLSRNYITHLVALRKSILDKIGRLRIGFEGSQDYDLMLRFTEQTNKIYHIPKVLYHWRKHEASAAMVEEAKPYAYIAGENALNEALERRGEKGASKLIAGLPGFYSVRYDLIDKPLVSILIPTKDKTDVLKVCVDSIFEKSTYENFEVIILDNGSKEKKFFEFIEDYERTRKDRFKYVPIDMAFNFSSIINKGAKEAKGDYLLLLNNDTEVITEDFIEAMLEQSSRENIGAVGVKLLYHNDTIQHAGVVIGLGGVAGHTFISHHKDDKGYFHYLKSINNYSAVTAACLMIKKETFDQVGGFEEDLAVEYNDVDFCLKLIEAGYRNVWLPHVSLYHYESLSRGHPHLTKESYERHVREVQFFKDKWQKYIKHDPHYSPNLSLDVTNFSIRA